MYNWRNCKKCSFGFYELESWINHHCCVDHFWREVSFTSQVFHCSILCNDLTIIYYEYTGNKWCLWFKFIFLWWQIMWTNPTPMALPIHSSKNQVPFALMPLWTTTGNSIDLAISLCHYTPAWVQCRPCLATQPAHTTFSLNLAITFHSH